MNQTVLKKGIKRVFKTQLICLFSLILTLFSFIMAEAQRNEATVAGIWTFNDGTPNDSSNKGLNGTFVGEPESIEGIVGMAFMFDGEDDAINIPDSVDINIGGPYPNRTIAAFFKCTDITKPEKQVIFQEGGATRGLCIYVHDAKVYIGGWNRAQYNWEGSWTSARIRSNRWYHVALIIRDATDQVENEKFEMWLDGKLVGKEEGGQLYAHTNNTSIGYVTQKTIYHDGIEDLSNVGWFSGVIDEVLVYNSAFDETDLAKIAKPLSIEPSGKITTRWGYLKER